jgi:hypothetical protein
VGIRSELGVEDRKSVAWRGVGAAGQ